MRHYKKINITNDELQYISSDKSYEAYLEQIEYNLIRIKSIGNLTVEHATSVEKIISNILSEFNKLNPKQKIYFINDITKLERNNLEAIDYIFSKIKCFNNLGGIIIVGKNPVIKIALSASSYFIKEFVLKFFNTMQEALDYYNKFLSINKDFVNNYLKKIDNKYIITFGSEDTPTQFYMEFDGDDIITNKPLGVADRQIMIEALRKFDKEIYPSILNGKMYYRVHDFTNFETNSGNSSRVFIKWIKEHIHQMHLLIFCGLNNKNSALIKLGRLLFKEKNKILIVDTLEEAYTEIYRHKNEHKQINSSNLDLPESNEELKDLVKYLLKENQKIKNIVTNSSKNLFNLLSEMTWPKDHLQKVDFDKELIPEPFENVVETIKVIYNDLQELILSRDEEYKKSKLLEERYRKIMQLIPKIAIRGYNKDLEILFWNNAGKEIFDLTPKEAIGKNLKDIYLCRNYVKLIESAVNKAIGNKTTGEFLKSSQQILFNEEGEKLVIYSIHTTLFDNEGDQIFFSLDFDLTKQYEIEEELRNHKENLEELVSNKTAQLEIEKNKAQESDRLKTAFLANMSHEIRSPMNTIIGFSDLLKTDDLSSEKRDKFITLINNSGNHLLNIINDIIDISKIEASQISIKKDYFNLQDVLKSIEKEFCQKIEKLSKVEFIIKDNENIIIYSDLYRIHQILTNLISNAIKFTHEGSIELSYKIIENNRIRISVKDTGIGIEQEHLEYIFHRFRQANEKSTREYGGTGLGLTISRHLTEILDGQIFVKSTFGKGSEFSIELPYSNLTENEKSVFNKPKIQKIANLKNKNILLVEDDLSSAELIIELLKRKEINVTHADKGFTAIDLFNKSSNFDLVLLDIQLPDIDGYEIFSKIRKTNKTIPIVAQTAFALLNEREKILNFGFNDYLSKPIKKNILYEVLERYLIKKLINNNIK
jgi:signal transduction histidine kinase/CheY-like chemotaxis protein